MNTFLYILILILLVALLWQSIKIRELKFSLKNQKLSHVSSIKWSDLKRSDLQDGATTIQLQTEELPKIVDRVHYKLQKKKYSSRENKKDY